MNSLQKMMKDVALNDKQIHVDEQKDLVDGSTDFKRIGNIHFASKRYKDAIAAYTKGIEEGDKSIDVLANRSCAYLRTFNYKCALSDAEAALIIDKNHIKCIFRKVKALFGMALYRDAMMFLEKIPLESMQQNDRKIIVELMAEAKCFIEQSENGDYPWNTLYQDKSVCYDMAEYTSSVVVKEAPLKGRGLFATKMIKAGELILASKAFAYVQYNTSSEETHRLQFIKRSVPEIHGQLVAKITEILTEYPEKNKIVGSLYAGAELGYLKCTDDVSNDIHIDTERIENISIYNAISTYDTIYGSFITNTGLWIIPSFLNHSCVDANSSWVIIGDFLFVRAFHNISEGEEILIPYRAPTGLIAQKSLDMYDFICQCRVCERDRLDNVEVQVERATIFCKLEEYLKKSDACIRFQKQNEIEIQRLFKLLEKSRQDAPELNLCLVCPLIKYGDLQHYSKKFLKSAATFEKLYNLTKNVAVFQLAAVVACIKIALSYVNAKQLRKADHWAQTLKKHTKLGFGTLHVLNVKFYNYITILREYGLDI